MHGNEPSTECLGFLLREPRFLTLGRSAGQILDQLIVGVGQILDPSTVSFGLNYGLEFFLPPR